MMKNSWRKAVVGEYLDDIPSQEKIKKSEYLDEGDIPIVDQGAAFIAGYTNDKDKAYSGSLPVIVFGDHTRILKYLPCQFAIGADGTQLLRPNKQYDIRYFYYALINLKLKNYGYERHFKYLKKEVIPLPDLPAQRRIASILSAYDDLIENNNRRIKILEQMAQMIYREWFVNFRFPGHEKVKMVDSKLGNGSTSLATRIPEGWEVKRIEEVCVKLNSGGTPKRLRDEYWSPGAINWFKTKELHDGFLFSSEEKISELGMESSSARYFDAGDVVMAIYAAPTVGRLGILTERSTFNQAMIGFKTDKEQISNIYLFYVLLAAREHLNNISQGAAQQNISKEKVAQVGIIVPTKQIIGKFDKIIGNIWEAIVILEKAIINLRYTRDLLLPRLMGGEIEV